MNFKPTRLIRPTTALIAFFATGCLVHETRIVLRYDAAADAFHMFALYEHFRSTQPTPHPKAAAAPVPAEPPEQDVTRLRELWQSRDRMIPVPLPIPSDGPPRLELSEDRTRLADHTGLPADLDVTWRDVRIRPGRLFRDRDGLLGYWHDVTIPGRVVDQLLRELRARLARNPQFLEWIDRELADRRRTGRPPLEWPDLARRVTRQVERLATAQPAEADDGHNDANDDDDDFDDTVPELLAHMEGPSLQALRRLFGPDGAGPDLTRAGGGFRLRLPLTPRDANGLASTFRALAGALAGALTRAAAAVNAPPGDVDPNVVLGARLADAFKRSGSIAATPDGHCLISVDLVPVLNELSAYGYEASQSHFERDANAQANARAMSAAARRWPDPKPQIDENVDPRKLLDAAGAQRAGR